MYYDTRRAVSTNRSTRVFRVAGIFRASRVRMVVRVVETCQGASGFPAGPKFQQGVFRGGGGGSLFFRIYTGFQRYGFFIGYSTGCIDQTFYA